jgi:hypothetical protein
MTSPDTSWRLAALAVAATAAADRDEAHLQRQSYERLHEEALRLNRRAEWASDESIASVLPSLSALDEIAALDAAFATGVDRAAGPDDVADAARIEARLRDLAAWATGIRTACELATELRDDD